MTKVSQTLNEMLLEESNQIRISMGKKPQTQVELTKKARAKTLAGIQTHLKPFGKTTFDGISILPLPDRTPDEIVETNETFIFMDQKDKVVAEKHMISDEGIIPASIGNKVTKIINEIKNVFHKEPPITTTLTKRAELDGRNLQGTYNEKGFIVIVVVIIVIYLIMRGK